MRTIIINNPGPQGAVGPQGNVGPSGSTQPFSNVSGSIWATTSSLEVTGSFIVSGSSTFTNIGPAVFSGSVNATSGVTMSSALVSGDVTVLGTASINVLQINTTINSTGSNTLGDSVSDTQTLFGSVVIPTGSLVVSGIVSSGNSLNTNGGSTVQGELRSYQLSTVPIYLSLQTTSGKSGLFRSNTDYILYYDTSTGDTVLNSSFGGAALKFNLQNSEKMRILSNGNVGMGTTTPSASLHIKGATTSSLSSSLLIENSSSAYSFRIKDNGDLTATSNYINISSYDTTINGGNNVAINGAAFNPGYIYRNGTTSGFLSLANDGTAASSITLFGSTHATLPNLIRVTAPSGIQITGSLGVSSNLTCGTINPGTTTNISGMTVYQGTIDPSSNYDLRLIVPTATKGVIVSQDYSFLSSPSALFEVKSTSKGFLPPRTNTTASISSPAQGLMTYLTGSTNEGLYYYNSGSQTGWHRVLTNTGSQSITGSLSIIGNVGIGVNASTFNLDVPISTGGGVRFSGALGGNLSYSYAEYIGAYYVAGWSSIGNIGLRSGASQRILISNTDQSVGITLFGNRLGLANATPSAKLHITGEGSGSATTALRVENSNASASMVVLDNGNVGIGTATPSRTLDINGNVGVTGNIIIAQDAGYGVFSNFFQHNASPFQYSTTNIFSTNAVASSLASTGLRSSYLENIIWQQSSGTAEFASFRAIPTLNTTGTYTGIIRGFHYNPTVIAATGSAHYAIHTQAGDVLFGSGSTSIMLVSGSGNVGIGTNTPAYALDVRTTSGFIVSAFKSQYAATGYIGTDNSTIWIGRGTDGFNSAFVASSNLLIFRANNSQVGEFWSTGNLTIQTGGTYTDDGYKLDVKGSTRVRGTGTTSATTALRVENTNASASMVVLDNGFVGINTGSAQYNLDVNGIARVGASASSGQLYVKGASGTGQYIYLDNGASGVHSFIGGGSVFALDRDGVRQFSISQNAQMTINGNTNDSSAQFQIESTTRGFLPPRMTNAQRVAISTPAVGLMVYCTDATEGLYIYKSTGWTFIV